MTKKNEHVIKINIEKKDWADILDNTFKKKNAQVTIKGFRKGKAPKDVFLKEYGIESLYMDSVDEAIQVAYKKVLEDNELIPVCEPKVDISSIDQEHVEFEFTIITKPEVKVSSYKNLGVKKETPKVTKKEIEEELNGLRSRFAEIVEKEDGKVVKGDIAVIDFEGFVDGKAFEGGKGKDYPLEIGSQTFIPGFEEQLEGTKAGESKDVKVTFPKEYQKDLAGKDAVFKCTVKKVQTRVLPELNEEFYKDLGYEDVKTKEELEKKIEEHLLEHKKQDAENKYFDELMAAGVKNVEVDINDEIVDDELNRMLNELDNNLKMQGVTKEQYFQFTNTTVEAFKENMKPTAIDRIKSRYLLDYIIETEKLEAKDADIKKHAKEMAEKYGVEADELIEMYGGMDNVKYDLLIHKAMDILQS